MGACKSSHLYNYDDEGRLSTTGSSTYVYDTEGRRAAGTTGSSPTGLWLQVGGGSPAFTSGQTINMWGAQMVVGTSDGTYVATTSTTTNPTTGATEYLAANGLNEHYVYDSFGNMLQTGNFTFEQAYTSANQLSGWNYDQSGNLLTDQISGAYTYDANDMVATHNGTTYIYDASGNRVEKQGSTVMDTVYFGGQPIARHSGVQWTDLIYGPTGLLAEVPGTQTGPAVYRVTDNLGTNVGSLLANGSFVNPVDHAPFGQVFTGSTTDPYLFTGKERDSESGLDYFGARYYSSNMGRFSSPDPLGNFVADGKDPQSWNMYAYARNNPLSNVDPTGYDCVYFNNDGNAAESVDHNSNSDECGQHGGDWVNGHTETNQVNYNSGSDTFNIKSSDALHNYNTTANAPGTQNDGTSCYGNCDTSNGYSSSLKAFDWLKSTGILDTIKNSPVTASYFQPLPGAPIVGFIPQVGYIPRSKTLCVGAGLGLGSRGGNAAALTLSNPDTAEDVMGGLGWSFTAQATGTIGYSANFNSSGVMSGPSVGSTGLSMSYGYMACGVLQ